MKVYELKFADVKTDNGEYLDDPVHVEHDERGYVVIRNK